MNGNQILVGILLVLITLFSLSACSAGSSAPMPTSIPAASSPAATTPTSSGAGDVNSDPKLAEYTLRARAELAKKLNVSLDSVVLKRAEAVQWPDSSLGCPRPGEFYSQIVTPGYLIVLEVNGNEYEYHGDRNTLFLCEK